MRKVSIETLEKYIQQHIDEISHMDEVSLPAVLLELRAEQAVIDNLDDHKSITHIEEYVIRNVFFCWMGTTDGEAWFKNMLNYDEMLRFIENDSVLTK